MTEAIGQRYLEIEHYFSDQILEKSKMKGKPILGSNVFEIVGKKTTFADKVKKFPDSEHPQFLLKPAPVSNKY